MNVIKSVICAMMMMLASFSINSTERPQDFPIYGNEHLYESWFVRSVVELYPEITEPEAKKVVSLVNYYAQEMDISPTVALAMIGTESSFRKHAVSPTGAGYTQVYTKYHKDKIKNRNIFKTQVNIEVGLSILSDCVKKRGNYQKALACYNGAISPDKAKLYNKKIRKHEKKILTKVYEIVLTG